MIDRCICICSGWLCMVVRVISDLLVVGFGVLCGLSF